MNVTLGVCAGKTRALRLLLLFVLALAAIQYIIGSILDASPLRTYLYIPGYNITPAAVRNKQNVTDIKLYPVIPGLGPIKVNRNAHVLDIVENKYPEVSWGGRYSPPNNTTPAAFRYLINKQNVTKVKICPVIPPGLGPNNVNRSAHVLDIVENKYHEVSWGGRYSPPNCVPRHNAAIIVPYRDREQHLSIFLNHMHPFLMKQQLEYGIFIIEQYGKSDFNRARLMNVGFKESQKLKEGGWQCTIFHDIDKLPLNSRNLYWCPRWQRPRHMSVYFNNYNFALSYPTMFGGVSAMTREQFTKVNGFSNNYWGWGGEDDDMYFRLRRNNYFIDRYNMSIARYATLYHKKAIPNKKRYRLLSQEGKSFLKDGLTTLKYELVNISQHHLYTHVLVNVDEHSLGGT